MADKRCVVFREGQDLRQVPGNASSSRCFALTCAYQTHAYTNPEQKRKAAREKESKEAMAAKRREALLFGNEGIHCTNRNIRDSVSNRMSRRVRSPPSSRSSNDFLTFTHSTKRAKLSSDSSPIDDAR